LQGALLELPIHSSDKQIEAGIAGGSVHIQFKGKAVMKRFILLPFIVLLISLPMLAANTDNDLATRTAAWNIEHPQSLPHWMTPEEEARREEIGRDFYETDPPVGPVHNIAEFERMQSVLIRYYFGISYTVIAAMSQECNVTTIVTGQSQQNTVTSAYSSQGVNLANCDFIWAPSNSYWTRDYGPWFIIDGNDEFGIVNFPYNRPRPDDNDIPIEVADYLGINLFGMNVITAGGNYMTDGLGISSSSTLIWEENPGQTHAEIEQKVEDYLGVQTYHVVEDPNNTYIDHIDCWGKFLAPDKVLIREVAESHAQYDEIEATAAYYAAQMSSWGVPFEVYRVYTPQNQPYTNSLILNDRVFVPITGSGWDDDALASYEAAMPGYEILGFTGSWESTDALHCRTKGIADLGMLLITHQPLLGNQPSGIDYDITAEITAHSGQALLEEQLLLWYRVNAGDYTSLPLTESAGSFEATIPAQAAGSEIAYYLQAADASGRSENHPFIGAADPHVFMAGTPIPPELEVTPTEFAISLPPDATNEELLYISNIGGGVLDWEIELNSGEPVTWLTVDPQTGQAGAGETDTATLYFDTAGLDYALYTCDLTVNGELVVPVTLTVANLDPQPPLDLQILIYDNQLYLYWTAEPGATSYNVYSSSEPYSGFTEDTSGAFSGSSWSTTLVGGMRFYQVTAVVE
jgi:agmatine deiminase